jgi:uncharacterized protein (TIGR02452 family)
MNNRTGRARIAAETMEILDRGKYLHLHRVIVLGAWGCGVFSNDPVEIAGWMYEALLENSLFVGAFDRVIFAVLDGSENQQTFRAFRDRFIM